MKNQKNLDKEKEEIDFHCLLPKEIIEITDNLVKKGDFRSKKEFIVKLIEWYSEGRFNKRGDFKKIYNKYPNVFCHHCKKPIEIGEEIYWASNPTTYLCISCIAKIMLDNSINLGIDCEHLTVLDEKTVYCDYFNKKFPLKVCAKRYFQHVKRGLKCPELLQHLDLEREEKRYTNPLKTEVNINVNNKNKHEMMVSSNLFPPSFLKKVYTYKCPKEGKEVTEETCHKICSSEERRLCEDLRLNNPEEFERIYTSKQNRKP